MVTTTAVACAVVTAFVAQAHRSGPDEPSPAAEGYRQVGTVAGARFWLDTQHAQSIGLRTTGRLG